MFASNLNKAKNGRFVSTTPWLYTAEHRRQRFKARVSTRSAKSTLIINSSKLRKITHQNSIRGNLNLPYKPLESILSRADLEKALHADIIIHHYYPSPLHHNHHQHPHHYHYHNHQRQLQQKHHHHQYHLKYHHINIFTIITITIIIIINCLEHKHVEKEVEYMSDSVGHHCCFISHNYTPGIWPSHVLGERRC